MKLAVGTSYKITDGLGKSHVGMCVHVHEGSFGRLWADMAIDAPVENVRVAPGEKTVVLRKREADLEAYEQ